MHFIYTSGFPYGLPPALQRHQFATSEENRRCFEVIPSITMHVHTQVAELAKERDFAAVQKHAAAEAAAALETRARATAEQHRADIKALQSQISQLKVRSQ